jgi:hypothetical protein
MIIHQLDISGFPYPGGVRSRAVIDYALQRRARLSDVAVGRVSRGEVCDAHPHLRLAARHYGEPARQACPVCQRSALRLVHYVYGDSLGKSAGQAKSRAELSRLAAALPEFDVYVVEVCQDCGWNHLIRSFVAGAATA